MHDPNNKDCPRNREIEDLSIFESWACTCPPAVDEVERIRKLNSDWTMIQTFNPSEVIDTLLRIVDQLRAENEHLTRDNHRRQANSIQASNNAATDYAGLLAASDALVTELMTELAAQSELAFEKDMSLGQLDIINDLQRELERVRAKLLEIANCSACEIVDGGKDPVTYCNFVIQIARRALQEPTK